MKLYVCKICGTAFAGEQELEYHFYNSDEKHERLADEIGIRELVEEEEVEEEELSYPHPILPPPLPVVPLPISPQQELLASKSKKTKEEVVPYSQFPIKITDNLYSNLQRNLFYDSVTKKEYTAEALIDFLKQSEREDELLKFLQWKTKGELKKVADSTGVHITERELEKISHEELLARLFKAYFTQPQQRESLAQYVSEKEQELFEFFNGKRDICPYCGKVKNSWFLGREYEFNQIKRELNIKPKSPIELDEVLNSRGNTFSYKGKQGFMPLAVLIHLCLEHPQKFKKLVENGTLTFKLPIANEYVKSKGEQKKAEKQRPKEQLTSDKVSDELLRKWLLKKAW